jgi:hypothetical protein
MLTWCILQVVQSLLGAGAFSLVNREPGGASFVHAGD